MYKKADRTTPATTYIVAIVVEDFVVGNPATQLRAGQVCSGPFGGSLARNVPVRKAGADRDTSITATDTATRRCTTPTVVATMSPQLSLSVVRHTTHVDTSTSRTRVKRRYVYIWAAYVVAVMAGETGVADSLTVFSQAQAGRMLLFSTGRSHVDYLL
ncbi:hypothetical protein NP493_119g09001 [Ridgeia piscesae]|uniref:Uncharacterized protein n=1 Tax=Ridgeia piscesae TaxID=27915 RepID=A0AAD9P6C9_RIDPI|nr:hypothetical protein NP493_119g09001 [Ridgeia piscesae]